MSDPTPRGFRTYVANAGVKDSSEDFVCIASEEPCAIDAVFTQSRFAGPCVVINRERVVSGRARAIVAVSKNANVATGEAGERDARELSAEVARSLDVAESDVLVAGTGVIGRRWPMDRLLPHAARVGEATGADFEAAARGIMTTDTRPKLASARIGDATLVGIAKGVGMIEPNMATLFVFLFTDARVEPSDLSSGFREAIDRTFNSMSIDTDTSTSDTATIMANGLAGDVDPGELAEAVDAVCMELMLATLGDGEGATRTISVTVETARDAEQAKTVGKLVVNSPLVKTAINGADPNWGRIAMAVGKAERYDDISPERTRISLAGMDVYPEPPSDQELEGLSKRIGESDLVEIGISLGAGEASATVWGCDLSKDYVRINAEYTT